MVMIKNLIYSPVVPPCTATPLLLKGSENHRSTPENGEILDAVGSNNFKQKTIGLQGPNPDIRGYDGTEG